MSIKKITLNGMEISKEDELKTVEKYIQDKMTLECFLAGFLIKTPDGDLQAEVEFNL